MRERAKGHLLAIFQAGVAAADPAEAVRRHVSRDGPRLRIASREFDLGEIRRVFVVGAGKASARMALALEDILGDRIAGGWLNVKTGHGLKLEKVHVNEAGHPVPDAAGLRGTREIVRIARDAEENDLVLCCFSGGGSSLLPLPVKEVPLEDKQALTRQLLACGADIREVNSVRKHLSQVKGGQLARLAWPARTASLILSDVVGDALDTIASGPTAPDETTFADALSVLEKYRLRHRAPERAVEYLAAGAAGRRPETPKAGEETLSRVCNVIVADNGMAVDACSRKAGELGYRPLVLSTMVEGEARELARLLVAVAQESLAHGRPAKAPACLIAGGETTVTVTGDGLGGRNQEVALSAAVAAAGLDEIAVLAAGTDGTDGPTDAAGAFADGATCGLAAARGLDAAGYLARNDSYHFFEPLGDLLKTGPTGTNVMDLYLVLVGLC